MRRRSPWPTLFEIEAVARMLAAGILLFTTAPAFAHGFSSVVYVDVTSPARARPHDARAGVRPARRLRRRRRARRSALPGGHRRVRGRRRGGAGRRARRPRRLGRRLRDQALRRQRRGQRRAPPTRDGDFKIEQRDGVPYALLALDYRCPEGADAHELRSGLFPDSEGYVRDTKTIVTYDLDLRSGSAGLDAKHPSFSTHQSLLQRYWEFFRLGAEHLYTGIDHILFLLALIAGSRRLREIVLAATTFTLAHSVTFILAALGLVEVPASLVEPVIALSISVVAGLHLWRIWRRGSHATDLETAGHGRLGLDARGGRGSRWSSASASCTGSGSPRRSGSTRPSRGRCCRRCSSSTWASRPCSWRSSSSSSPCSPCCAAARRSPGSRRPGRSPRACARWASCGSRSASFEF